jgi:hypothetical protein
LAALVVLVVEGLLAFLLTKAEAKDVSLYVILMVAMLLLTVLSASLLNTKESGSSSLQSSQPRERWRHCKNPIPMMSSGSPNGRFGRPGF